MSEYPNSSGGWKKYGTGTLFDIAVLEDGDLYYMYLSWRPRESLALATSKDGIHWSELDIVFGPDKTTGWERNKNNPVISPTKDLWDGEACYKPFAVYNGSRWLLWYNGSNWVDQERPEYIGLATHEGIDLGF